MLSTNATSIKHALFGTRPGRAIVVGLGVKLIVAFIGLAAGGVPALLSVADTVAGLAIAIGAAYYLFRLLAHARRRLLWRVRRKLILSYIFIGFVPAILLVAFFALCGLLLFFNFGSYLVQTEVGALRDRARLLATSAALEIQRGGERDAAAILARRLITVEPEYQSISLALVPVDRPCAQTNGETEAARTGVSAKPVTAGLWAHVDPPLTLPEWIGCKGFSGLLAYSQGPRPGEDARPFVRAVAFPDSPTPGYAVVADLLVTDLVKRRFRRDTGVELVKVVALDIDMGEGRPAKPIAGRPGDTSTWSRASTGPFSWVTFLEYQDWPTGRRGTLLVSTALSIPEIYSRIGGGQGTIGNRSFGQTLLVILLVVVGGLFLVIEAAALVAGLALAKSITGSVHALFTGTERVRAGDFTHKISVKAQDQLGELAGSFNSMTASIEGLLVQAAETERLEEELRIAHEIQMSLLPQAPCVMPGLTITALSVPAREVGGDYYDFLPLDDHRVGVLIADVSGKGTSAALYMAELKGLVLSLSRIHTSPRELLIMANRLIAEHLDRQRFITMTYAVVDLHARTMTYARAGHTPLISVPGPGASSRQARIHTPDGLVLGLKIDNGDMFERLLEEETLPLQAGDVYLFFTDGITEAMNASNDCYGEQRLPRFLESHAELSSEDLRDRIRSEIEAFVGGAPQHDDMTLILLRVGPDLSLSQAGRAAKDGRPVATDAARG